MNKALASLYKSGLTTLWPKIAPLQREILQSLAYGPVDGISALQLAALLRQRDKIVINGAFGRLGRALWPYVKRHPEGLSRRDFQWWSLLATGDYVGDEFHWTLLPEVRQVVRSLSAPRTLRLVDQVETTLKEGRVRTARLDRYERHPIARRRCLETHGFRCAVCGIQLDEIYGPIARELIHVHHLTPLSKRRREHIVDPVRDLRPVCPNCHAVIHVGVKPIAIDDLKRQLRRKSNSA